MVKHQNSASEAFIFFPPPRFRFFPPPAVYFSCNPHSEAFIFSLHRGFVFSRLRLSFFPATNQQPGLLFFPPWTTDSWSFPFFPPGVRRRNSCTTTRRVLFPYLAVSFFPAPSTRSTTDLYRRTAQTQGSKFFERNFLDIIS